MFTARFLFDAKELESVWCSTKQMPNKQMPQTVYESLVYSSVSCNIFVNLDFPLFSFEKQVSFKPLERLERGSE